MKNRWKVINHGMAIEIRVKRWWLPFWHGWSRYAVFYRLHPSEPMEFDDVERAYDWGQELQRNHYYPDQPRYLKH